MYTDNYLIIAKLVKTHYHMGIRDRVKRRGKEKYTDTNNNGKISQEALSQEVKYSNPFFPG